MTTQKSKFNPTNDNIEWAKWTWNPVTGCKFGCPYCYAKDIANRFNANGFEPTFHENRLSAPTNTNVHVHRPPAVTLNKTPEEFHISIGLR